MCGIAGILDFDNVLPEKSSAIKRMTDAQFRRGPDAEGFFHSPQVSLGHRRLSIIDLTSSANQPMPDNTGRYQITFNGEIYNFRQIRSELRNYKFKTNSDTEVILAAFSEWGGDCLSRLKGQFAFGIWDSVLKELFIARDRLGEKPFYYYKDARCFVFASELRALLRSGLVPKKISPTGLADYLRNEAVRSPNTMLDGVFQLPAAHFGRVNRSGFTIKNYWTPISKGVERFSGDYAAVCKNVKDLLHRSIDGQIISDVPLGVFLSGGIDSSAIVALVAERSTQRVNTLSIVFDEDEYDENRYSSLVAKKFSTDHQTVRLKPGKFLEELPEYFRRVDSPSGDGSNTYIISKAAKEAGLTVALNGIGGDELFAGYRSFKWYRFYMAHSYLWKLPSGVKKMAASLAALSGKNYNASKIRDLASLGARDHQAFYALTRGCFSPAEIVKLLPLRSNEWERSETGIIDFTSESSSLPLLSQFSVLELSNYTQNVLLKDADNMGMANSLEIRVPFCDSDLFEYVVSVPDKYKFPNRPKQLLVDSLSGMLPDEIVNRPKMGFSFPWGKWLKEDLNPLCSSALDSLCARGLFNEREIRAIWYDYNAQKGYSGWSRIWLLVVLEEWMKENEF